MRLYRVIWLEAAQSICAVLLCHLQKASQQHAVLMTSKQRRGHEGVIFAWNHSERGILSEKKLAVIHWIYSTVCTSVHSVDLAKLKPTFRTYLSEDQVKMIDRCLNTKQIVYKHINNCK